MTTIPGQKNTHYFLDQGISLLNMCYDFYPWLWLYKYVPPFANWAWVKHLWDAVDRERWMIWGIPRQTPCAELWRLGDASVLFGWGETALPQYPLVLFLRAMARHDLEQLSSLQRRQILRYAQLWRLTQSWCKPPFFRAMHDTFWCPPQISCIWHRALWIIVIQ